MAESTSNAENHRTVELSQAFEHIEHTLSGVLCSIQRLNEESQIAKEEIRATFGRQLSHLHGRETQLLRQVDLIFRARRELMQKQLAHCYRLLGSLETSKKWTEESHKYKCLVALDNSDFDGMKKWGTSNPLNWTLDEKALNKAIANFGKVDMDGVLLLSSGEQSKSLPARVEEYIDEDHQVLNKPLKSKVEVIDMKFPKLPYKEGSSKLQEEKSDSSYGPYRKGTYSYKPCDVQTWLGCIQSEIAAEPMEDVAENLPEITNLSDSGSIGSKESDSIEIVSLSNLCIKPSLEVVGSSKSCPLNLGSSEMEIENIADNFNSCLKNEKQSWLLVTDKKETNDVTLIAKACRANALCNSFDECVCDTNCSDTVRKNRKAKENQKWLRPSSPLPPVNTTSIFPSIFPDGDNSKWLRPATPPRVPVPSASTNIFPSLFSNDDGNQKWLRPATPPLVTPSPLNVVFPKMASDGDNGKWLRPASPPPTSRLSTNPVFPKQFWDDDNSKWLHPESSKAFTSPKETATLYNISVTQPRLAQQNTYCFGSGFLDTSTVEPKSTNIWLAPSYQIADEFEKVTLNNGKLSLNYMTKQQKN